ncbi:MAG: peptidoglycan-binding protein [Ruthenibacterium sp.]
MNRNCNCNCYDSGTAHLQVRTFTAVDALPVTGAKVRVYAAGAANPTYTGTTGDDGILENMDFPCPPRVLSLREANTRRPYALVRVTVEADNYEFAEITDVQMFDTETTLADFALLPRDEQGRARGVFAPPDAVVEPPHTLYAGNGGSGLTPVAVCPVARVLTAPVIPQNITVHLGKPASSAQNVTVSFRDYIKNVASCEVYPTWPEQALRANIHAQISLALNRVYTEWYKGKGYSFTITNSTSYDQAYVHGRSIFEVMSRITDDIFNTYVQKGSGTEPYYTEYCDGKTVTCKGMKQWGSVTQANAGKNALQILRYYYGNDINVVRTDNIAAVPESYPGTPLRIGSTGTNVRILQQQLNRISKNYPFFGTLTVNGTFDTATQNVVKKFQKQFSLTQDGIVGRSTWYKISSIYVAVKKLAELTSEGEKPDGNLVSGVYPGTALRIGSRGDNVMQIQFWLAQIAAFTSGITAPAQDGIFGIGTENAVKAFQQKYNLAVDGVVGRDTWNEIYKRFTNLENDIAPPDVNNVGQYPGTPLRRGSTGNSVKLMQFYLRIIAQNNTAIPVITADGSFGAATENAVRTFQSFYGLTVDGIVGRVTWNKIYEVYTGLLNDLLAPSARPGTYPGTALRVGSSGQSVKEVQYYLYLLSAYYASIPRIAYDGLFGSATKAAVIAYQTLFKLTPDGIIGPATWNSIYAQFSKLRLLDGPVRAFYVLAYPGYVIQPGISGEMVRFVQFMLGYIGAFYEGITPIPALSGIFDTETGLSVQSFQREFGLPVTGTVDAATWNAMQTVYLAAAADAGEPSAVAAETYPGYVLTLGSAGQAVRQLQTSMNEIAARFCVSYFVEADGIFGTVTQDAVKQFQSGFGLPVTGIVDEATWDAIYNYANS